MIGAKDELVESHTWPGATTRASTGIVIASGRSIRDVCLPLFQVSGAKIVSVNNAVHYADFSDFVFTLDTVGLEERLHLPLFSGERIAAVPQDHWLHATRRDGKVADRHPDISNEVLRKIQSRVGFASGLKKPTIWQ